MQVIPKPRYEINGNPYISVTQILNYDVKKNAHIQKWKEGYKGPGTADEYRDKRAIIGTIMHWRFERFFAKRFNFPIPGKPILKDDFGNIVPYSAIDREMKDAMAVIWSYFEEWATALVEKGTIHPIFLEKRVWHDELMYAGTFDMLCNWNGKRALVDWKTASWIGDDHTFAAQLTAYEKALLHMGVIKRPVDKLLVVRVNEQSSGVDVHPCVRDWSRFLECLERFNDVRASQHSMANTV